MARTSLSQLERVYKSLGNKRRLIVLQFIAAKSRASVGEVSRHVKLSFPSTSRHLRILANADLLESEQTSTTVYYSVQKERDAITETALRALK